MVEGCNINLAGMPAEVRCGGEARHFLSIGVLFS